MFPTDDATVIIHYNQSPIIKVLDVSFIRVSIHVNNLHSHIVASECTTILTTDDAPFSCQLFLLMRATMRVPSYDLFINAIDLYFVDVTAR